MECPACGHSESKVVDSRTSGDGIRRRRVCLRCDTRFTTHERIEVRMPLVVKKDGRRVPFERDKVIAGLMLACRKRPVTGEQIEEAASRVEQQVASQGAAEIPTSEIGRFVLNELLTLDKVGYLRFASVYQEIQDPKDFLALLEPWLGEQT